MMWAIRQLSGLMPQRDARKPKERRTKITGRKIAGRKIAGLGLNHPTRHLVPKSRSAALDRRSFIRGVASTSALVATGSFPTPAISTGASAQTLKFVPQSNLANFDPIWGTQYVVRNASALVWDTLYGVDENLQPQRQMVESEEVSSDGLTWTFKLRAGLTFHDGEPVLAKDAVASLLRWSARDSMGLMIRGLQNELTSVDDRTFRWVLQKPFPRMLLALAKTTTPCAFIMPARIAATDPSKQIGEYIGSGPMRFVREEWAPGVKAVFERFTAYVPRQEPRSWLAGGKQMLVDRIEWIVLPDPATAAAALQNGEVDWWENPLSDLVPLLKTCRDVVVDIADPLGRIGSFRMNHLHPPFNDVRARRAVLMAMSQEDYMRSAVGNDDTLWKPMPGFFTPGTPLYTEEGGEILKGPRDFDAAKRLLADSGYCGDPVTCLVAQDQPEVKAMGEVTADLLKRLGMNVDLAALDWGTVGARRAIKTPPGKGGWNMFHTYHGGDDCVSPASYIALRANGDRAWFGWPDIPEVETEIANWFGAGTLDDQRPVIRRLNRAALDNVVFAPTGFFLAYQAWRKNISGVAKGPLPFFWGVSKSI
jgi:peptide/nickel transport system substrate-binding protein